MFLTQQCVPVFLYLPGLVRLLDATPHQPREHILAPGIRFCHVGGVSSAAPCVGSPMIATGLGVRDRSCMSSVSQSTYLSKSPAGGLDGWVPVCVYSTHGPPWGVGPAGAVQGMG